MNEKEKKKKKKKGGGGKKEKRKRKEIRLGTRVVSSILALLKIDYFCEQALLVVHSRAFVLSFYQ